MTTSCSVKDSLWLSVCYLHGILTGNVSLCQPVLATGKTEADLLCLHRLDSLLWQSVTYNLPVLRSSTDDDINLSLIR